MLMNKMPFVDYIFVFKTCLGSAENASCLDIAFLGLCHFAGSAFIEHERNETLLYTKGVKMHKQHSDIIQNG